MGDASAVERPRGLHEAAVPLLGSRHWQCPQQLADFRIATVFVQ